MKPLLASAAGLMLTAGPVLAEGGPKPAEIAAFVAAVKAAGCVVTPENQETVFAASGLAPEVAAAVAQRLEDEGKMVLDAGDQLTLVPEACQ